MKHPDYDTDPTTVAERRAPDAALLEQVLLGGDLSKLTAAGRVDYYKRVCDSLGLNPLTKPFEFLTLNGKLRLYALRDCTEQLRKIHGISITNMVRRDLPGDLYEVSADFTDKTGRTDQASGVVSLKGLNGDARGNKMLACESKCKRRGTLSICGLGMLDETEVESIPGAKTGEAAITASQPPPMPRRLSEATVTIRAPISELEAAVAADRPLIVPDDQVQPPETETYFVPDAPVTRDEANAIYGAIRRAMREIGVSDSGENLAHAKAAVKQWAAAELGIQHLEDCPVGKPYLRLRGEIGRLVADAFAAEPGAGG